MGWKSEIQKAQNLKNQNFKNLKTWINTMNPMVPKRELDTCNDGGHFKITIKCYELKRISSRTCATKAGAL